MAVVLTLRLIVALAFLPQSTAFEWDDFTNNLATDLAPLIALFGEQVTKQFLSESLSIWDNIIFAVAPLGILTAVVSAIRIGGSPSLRAFIGRAQEGPGISEVELLSCTSETTSELWNEGGIARVFGKPQILEVVKVTEGESVYKGRDSDGNYSYTAGIKLFAEACDESNGQPPWRRLGMDPESEGSRHCTPNLSLNIGIKRLPKRYTYGAAVLGLALQTGVLIYAGLTAYQDPNPLLAEGNLIETYAFPLTLSGTMLVCVGMFICAFIIERGTQETHYKRNQQVPSKMYWVQPGDQKIGDQIFGSFVGVSNDSKYIRSSKALRKDRTGNKTLWTAVITTIIGFVTQFVGLRAMHSSVILAQLLSTIIMAIIRACLRTQRMDPDRDVLASDPDIHLLREYISGHELDYLAMHLEEINEIDVSVEKEGSQLEEASQEIQVLHKGARSIIARACLAKLTCENSGHPWKDLQARRMATQLLSAIEGVMQDLSLEPQHTQREQLQFYWEVNIRYKPEQNSDAEIPKYRLYLRKRQGFSWKADLLELESLIGLWAWSLRKHEVVKTKGHTNAKNARLVASFSEPGLKDAKIWHQIWIQRRLGSNEMIPLPGWTAMGVDEASKLRFFGWQALQKTNEPGFNRALYVLTQNEIMSMCAQDIFISFLAAALQRVEKLDGKTDIRTDPIQPTAFQLRNSGIEEMVDHFEECGLGSREDGYMCIVPVLTRNSKFTGTIEGLHLAAQGGHEAAASALVAKGADLNAKNENGLSALHLAALHNHEGMVRLLIGKGAKVNSKNEEGSSALHLTAMNGHKEAMKALIEKRADVNSKNEQGWTALHFAAMRGYKEVVKGLACNGAHINEVITGGLSALYLAVERGHKEVVRELVEMGANVNLKDMQGWTPIHCAASRGYEDIVGVLVKKGADVNEKNQEGMSVLHLAVEQEHKEMVRVLIREGADIDAKNKEELSALHLAAGRGYEEVVRVLIEERADVNAKGKQGWTAVHFAASRGYEDVVRDLVGREADTNAETEEGLSTLHLAVDQRHEAVVRLLLEKKTDVNKKSKSGWTALHFAAFNGDEKMARMLVGKMHDISNGDEKGRTALHLAAMKGHKAVARLLLGLGADANAKDGNGCTALHLAEDQGHEALVRELEKRPNLIHDRRPHHRYHHILEDVIVKDIYSAPPLPRSHRIATSAEAPIMDLTNTITVPCHHIRIGDLIFIQCRPCQVIRITTSSKTGQYRYIGVDLFTKQLHEESSFISNPRSSVVIQSMLGPIFRQYRVLEIREDGRIVAMTETGDVKQGVPVLDQGNLFHRLTESFDSGRGSVRILVIEDDGLEMAVDFKVVHGNQF